MKKRLIAGSLAVMTALSMLSVSTAMAGTAVASAEKKPELKALMRYGSYDPNTNPVAVELEKLTGYKVKYDMLPADNAMDKLNLIIAASEPYDYIAFTDVGRAQEYAKQGALVELGPLIEKYGPNIAANTTKGAFDYVAVGGKYYILPTAEPIGKGVPEGMTQVGTAYGVRADWLESLNLKMPTTLDEFQNVLQQFKDKDPGENKDTNIPLTGDNVCDLDFLVGAFGMGFDWNDVDGKLVPKVLMPGYKDYLTYMKGLYDKGLLDKEFPTNKVATTREKFTSGRAGVMPINWADVPTILDALGKTRPQGKLAFLAPLSSKDNKGVFQTRSRDTLLNMLTIVPKASKRQVDVIKYFDLKMDEENFKKFVIGYEGVHHTVSNGNYSPINPKFFDERTQANNYLTGATKNYGTYWLARLKKDTRLYEAWREMNIKYNSFLTMSPVGAAPAMSSNSKYNQVLTQMTTDMRTKIVSGASPLSYYDEFCKEWLKAGGQEVIDEYNKWYVEYLKTK